MKKPFIPPRLRALVFWPHLILGVLSSIIVVSICITGCLLAVELQVTRFADRQLVEVPSESQLFFSMESLASDIERQEGRIPHAITIGQHPHDPATASFGRRDRVLFNPWTGESIGQGARQVKAVFRGAMTFHRWLSMEGDARNIGRQIIGGATLIFVLLVPTGLVLWLPRRLRWSNIRSVLFFRRGLRGKARDFNWHNVLGVWTALPLLILGITGAAITYGWLNDGLVRLGGGEVQQHQSPRQTTTDASDATEPVELRARLRNADTLLARVATDHPDWNFITLDIPASPDTPLNVTVDTGNGRQPQHRITLEINRDDATVLKRSGWEELPRARQVKSWIRFGHTGEILGIWGQLLAGLATAAGGVLAFTGAFLSLRRFNTWRRRRG